MSIRSVLRRAGAASPTVPAGIYVGVLSAASLGIALAPRSALVAAVGVLLWLAALVCFGVVVTWYRDDDWLAAGFLLGVTILMGGFVADLLTSIVEARSVGPAIFTAAGAVPKLLVRALLLVPLCGAGVWLARWITARVRRPPAPTSPPA